MVNFKDSWVESEGVTESAGAGVSGVPGVPGVPGSLVVGATESVGVSSETLGAASLGAFVEVLAEPHPVIKTPTSKIVIVVINSLIHLCLDIIYPPFS